MSSSSLQKAMWKDEDRALDADAILSSIRAGTEQANKVRRERGWATLEVVGWQQQPFYDPLTKNLTWSIKGNSDGDLSINHSTRLLGRRGVLKVNLVLSPEDVASAMAAAVHSGASVPAFVTNAPSQIAGQSERPHRRHRHDEIAHSRDDNAEVLVYDVIVDASSTVGIA